MGIAVVKHLSWHLIRQDNVKYAAENGELSKLSQRCDIFVGLSFTILLYLDLFANS